MKLDTLKKLLEQVKPSDEVHALFHDSLGLPHLTDQVRIEYVESHSSMGQPKDLVIYPGEGPLKEFRMKLGPETTPQPVKYTEDFKYIPNAVKTESQNWDAISARFNQNNQFIRLIHGAMGIQTELGELIHNELHNKEQWNRKEEIGDVCWYIAIMLDALGSTAFLVPSFNDNLSSPPYLLFCTDTAGDITDVLKKALFYGKPIELETLVRKLQILIQHLTAYATHHRINMHEVLYLNNEKLLSKRYKSGTFNEKDAINRDADSERKEFQ